MIVTTIFAGLCYWWLARPTIVAERFAAAISRGDCVAADALCVDPIREFVNRTSYNLHPRGSSNPNCQGVEDLRG